MTALLDLGADVDWPDAVAAASARQHIRPGLGRLAELTEWLAAAQGRYPARPPRRIRLVVAGPIEDSVADLADEAGIGLRSLDPADGVNAGAAAADDEIDRGTDLAVLAAPDTDAAAVVVSTYTRAEPVALLPRGGDAIDTVAWIARAVAVRDGRRRIMPLRDRADAVLTELDSPALAAAAGFAVRAAARRTPLVLDGVTVVAAALLGYEMQARAARWWQVADTSPDPVSTLAVDRLGAHPLLDLGLTSGNGTAGVLAAGLVRAAALVQQ